MLETLKDPSGKFTPLGSLIRDPAVQYTARKRGCDGDGGGQIPLHSSARKHKADRQEHKA
ncbi:uncharacterized protein EI90DRAFT_3052134 [Cantharellus anzutake]|uniref:uncharacterized protein n=1 Tax=Cantharellus anzutake TaxID=1750568 RepID=UPI0019061994|nr:uncharacterized protein EI90DRAFT_3052134 [Cantharellus anzutake]KAF8333468.1 hypothetical protein EI90DRAFT_3052134 [Cantharellus anzutake]